MAALWTVHMASLSIIYGGPCGVGAIRESPLRSPYFRPLTPGARPPIKKADLKVRSAPERTCLIDLFRLDKGLFKTDSADFKAVLQLRDRDHFNGVMLG